MNTASIAPASTWQDGLEQLTYAAYRFSGYALLNWADDVAILAFMFC
jgi:hypothetical protein